MDYKEWCEIAERAGLRPCEDTYEAYKRTLLPQEQFDEALMAFTKESGDLGTAASIVMAQQGVMSTPWNKMAVTLLLGYVNGYAKAKGWRITSPEADGR